MALNPLQDYLTVAHAGMIHRISLRTTLGNLRFLYVEQWHSDLGVWQPLDTVMIPPAYTEQMIEQALMDAVSTYMGREF